MPAAARVAWAALMLLIVAGVGVAIPSCQRTDLASGPIFTVGGVPAQPTDDCPPPEPGTFQVKINEIMLVNETALPDEDGLFSPWVELYNPGATPAFAGGATLSDDPADDGKWEIPCIPEAEIPAGGFLVIFLDGDVDDANDLHASFIPAAGGPLTLVLNGTELVSIDGAAQEPDLSTGRFPDGSGTFGAPITATPGAPNEGIIAVTFIRGDVDANGDVDADDLDALLVALTGDATMSPCPDRLDVNDDGIIDVSDGSFLAQSLAPGGSGISIPFPDPGIDPTPDGLPECAEE